MIPPPVFPLKSRMSEFIYSDGPHRVGTIAPPTWSWWRTEVATGWRRKRWTPLSKRRNEWANKPRLLDREQLFVNASFLTSDTDSFALIGRL